MRWCAVPARVAWSRTVSLAVVNPSVANVFPQLPPIQPAGKSQRLSAPTTGGGVDSVHWRVAAVLDTRYKPNTALGLRIKERLQLPQQVRSEANHRCPLSGAAV